MLFESLLSKIQFNLARDSFGVKFVRLARPSISYDH